MFLLLASHPPFLNTCPIMIISAQILLYSLPSKSKFLSPSILGQSIVTELLIFLGTSEKSSKLLRSEASDMGQRRTLFNSKESVYKYISFSTLLYNQSIYIYLLTGIFVYLSASTFSRLILSSTSKSKKKQYLDFTLEC